MFKRRRNKRVVSIRDGKKRANRSPLSNKFTLLSLRVKGTAYLPNQRGLLSGT
jgi:hypothetical protein